MVQSIRFFLADSRTRVRIALLLASLMALVIVIVTVAPRALDVWHPYDYYQYVSMGNAVRQGTSPYGAGRYYPMPTILWVFLPLSFLPDWFRFVWVLGPFISILVLFGRRGLPLFLFTPLWFVVSDAMIDGWLFLPIAWMLADTPVWAGLGALAVFVKPQVLALPTLYLLIRWLAKRDWRNLITFASAAVLVCIPAFIVDPQWVGQMVSVLPQRADETLALYPTLTASVWSWGALGGIGWLVAGAVAVCALVLAWRAWRSRKNPFTIILLLDLVFVFVLYASNFVAALPILHDSKRLLIIALISVGAFILDRLIGNWGNGYVLIPLAILYFLVRDKVSARRPASENA